MAGVEQETVAVGIASPKQLTGPIGEGNVGVPAEAMGIVGRPADAPELVRFDVILEAIVGQQPLDRTIGRVGAHLAIGGPPNPGAGRSHLGDLLRRHQPVMPNPQMSSEPSQAGTCFHVLL